MRISCKETRQELDMLEQILRRRGLSFNQFCNEIEICPKCGGRMYLDPDAEGIAFHCPVCCKMIYINGQFIEEFGKEPISG